jgi:transglutaminase-like putative cysteine protease
VTATAVAGGRTAGRARVERTHDRLLFDIAATLALAAYSFVAGLGLIRVFETWTFLGDIVAVVVVGHGLSYAMRIVRVPSTVAVIVLTVVLACLVGWIVYPDTFASIFPTSTTWHDASADLSIVREQFAEAVTPVPYEAGWKLLALIGMGLAVLFGDTFAFRAHGRGEALVPAAVLFVFVAALGTDRARVRLTLALIAAGVVAVAMLRARSAKPAKTSLGPTRSPLAATLAAASVAALVVVVGAWALGPRLPGVDEEPWVDTQGRGGGGVTEIPSPLVDIRSELVEQSATEMFVVSASQPSNWRTSALPEFDGNTWGLPTLPLESTRGALTDPRPGSVPNEQVLTITSLRGRLVPAAADPIRVDGEGLRFNEDTSTLVRTDRELAAGDVITISSAMPSFTADELRHATASAPPDPIYLSLPADFPTAVSELAATVTASASTPYDKARTLQDWFRTNFEYSLEAPNDQSTSAIEAFLERRSGFCVHFAGTFAAMARSLGLPSRVARGYTTGLTRADGAYSVLGKNAHAWPEVWFDGYGWVSFEPTPGRGAPGAEAHTGVLPDQDDEPVGGAVAPGDVPITSTTVAIANGPDVADAQGPGIPDASIAPAPTVPEPVDHGLPWGPILVVAALLGLVAATPALARRLRRGHVPSDPATRIAELWARARRAIESTTGHRLDPALTPLEQARAASPQLPVAAQPLRALAEVATAATYAPPGELAEAGIEAHDPSQGPLQWCHEIERVANDALSPAGRVRHYFTDWR